MTPRVYLHAFCRRCGFDRGRSPSSMLFGNVPVGRIGGIALGGRRYLD